jgi:hypothetical protein
MAYRLAVFGERWSVVRQSARLQQLGVGADYLRKVLKL